MSHVWIIAEAGVNHNGRIELARQLIDAAASSKVDAIKFQSFQAEEIASHEAPKAAYQNATTGQGSQLDMLRRLELSFGTQRELWEYARSKGIMFLSTPFDEKSVDFLDELGVRNFKTASGELTNLRLLSHIASKRRPVILSTGMSTLGEVAQAVERLRSGGAGEVSLLHCVTEYPAPIDQMNLRAMITLREAFGTPVGLSDHTPGVEISIAAVAMGATVIEKHLTLDRSMEGPDHRASLDPAEFVRLVESIRHVEQALGDGRKLPAACELSNRIVARRSLFAAVNIGKGMPLTASMVKCQRPGNGISAADADRVIGRIALRDVAEGTMLEWEHLA